MSLSARLQHTLRDQLDTLSSSHATLLRMAVLRVSTKLGERLAINAPGSWEYRWMRGIRERAMAANIDELVALALELQRELGQWTQEVRQEAKKTLELSAVA